MTAYKKRIVDEILESRLKNKGAILIEGAKWCGKTTTAEKHAASVLYMSDPDQKEQNLQLAEISPTLLLKGAAPRLIDEWQLAPKLWDAVRYEVDHRDGFGHFLLTGSAVLPK
ncbi:MAG: AAA family ATPase, partial [Lachnospiraceae bacterium]|nr:AAA family ATPase [Lachnospiraceae bacterium]